MWLQIFILTICALFYILLKPSKSYVFKNKLIYNMKHLTYFVYATIVSVLLIPVCLWNGKTVENSVFVAKCLSPMANFYGGKFVIQNEENLKVDGSAVIISNHQSAFDIIGMFVIWNKIKRMAAMAKKEIKYFGAIGLIIYLSDTIFVERNNPNQRQKTLEEAIERLKRDQVKLWIYPEGTRNRERKLKLLPFRKGAFVMAVTAQVPIIPIVFSPYYYINEKKYIFNNGGKTIMKCLPPVATTGLTLEDVPDLQEKLYNLILNEHEELTKKVLSDLPTNYNIAMYQD